MQQSLTTSTFLKDDGALAISSGGAFTTAPGSTVSGSFGLDGMGTLSSTYKSPSFPNVVMSMTSKGQVIGEPALKSVEIAADVVRSPFVVRGSVSALQKTWTFQAATKFLLTGDGGVLMSFRNGFGGGANAWSECVQPASKYPERNILDSNGHVIGHISANGTNNSTNGINSGFNSGNGCNSGSQIVELNALKPRTECNGAGPGFLTVGYEVTGRTERDAQMKASAGVAFTKKFEKSFLTAVARVQPTPKSATGKIGITLIGKSAGPSAAEVGTELTYYVKEDRTEMAVAASVFLDPKTKTTTLKTKVDEKGRVAGALSHKVSEALTVTFGAQFDATKKVAATNPETTKMGLKFTLTS